MLHPGIETRIALVLFGFLSAVFLPWWVVVIVAVVLSFFWRAWEVPLFGLFVDFVWSPVHTTPFFVIGAIVLVWLFEPIRKEFLA